ncbi:MAG: photosynthetic complex assembly protein PuhC [Sphingomonas sp.]
MSIAHSHENMLPRGALIGAGALVLVALTATSVARISGMTPAATPAVARAADNARIVSSRQLRFSDREDGAVVITDVRTGLIAEQIKPGSNSGFIRGVMRGFARDRRMRDVGPDAPFTLTLWNDGQLSLIDHATGRSVELNSFGSTNRQSFLELLTKPETEA